MNAALLSIGDWGHAFAAALFAALAIWVARGRDGSTQRLLIVIALHMTALWALCTSFSGAGRMLSDLTESLRNAAWLLAMFVLLRRGEAAGQGRSRGISALYAVVLGLLLLQNGVDVLAQGVATDAPERLRISHLALVLRMMVAVAALVLVHNLVASAPRRHSPYALLMAALAAMWTYDLVSYAFAYATDGAGQELTALRGLAMAALVPVIAIGAQRNGDWRLTLSRTATFGSLSLVAVSLYVMLIVLALVAIDMVAGPWARMVQIGGVFMMAVVAMLLLPSARFRAQLKVHVAKHFFQHRYDYRLEWMRFTDTIGRPGEEAVPFHSRVVQAVADITESPAGLLLLREEDGTLGLQTVWNWADPLPPGIMLDSAQVGALEQSGWIIDLKVARQGEAPCALPQWMLDDAGAWALVPLIHFDRLAGAILLARPRVDRRLDWEDLDMLRAAGRQVASYISEAQGQQALADARNFEEFNRRFAFIMHDIKNLVSQLSLLSRNAERHADNPAFRADMLLTLRESVGKMNDMLARLSQHNRARQEEPRAIGLRGIVDQVVRSRGSQGVVEVSGTAPMARADLARVEQILTHLLQNALEASAPGDPVHMRLGRQGDHASIEIADRGCGMSAEFIRCELFKPFVSTKPGGFGIGAFEARELARTMHGRILVESRPGEGSCFTLLLPMAAANIAHIEEKVA
ncbi:XrtA/PEP-CTERM system histidine kinase PrsK [Sphingobium aquiterrae]|uniref:XrtA/PEP-CTERM system histidine kinase PrsK n=1 Tax=Sphingobium aquiterrae TaxID=2038656 RepID=UPI0030176BE6